MNRIKLWPHAVVIVLVFAAIAGIAAALWMRYGGSAQAKTLPNAARIERVNGQVGVNQSLDTSNAQWIQATPNTPITVGDRIYTKENSRSEIAFTGRNFASIDANTALDILDLSSQRTQVALRNGSALFDVGSLASGDLFEVATPCGAVDLEQPGIYQVLINENGNAVATALSGAAQIVGQGGAGHIDKGEYLSIPCQSGSPAVLSRVDPNQAGPLIDNYYRNRYPRSYDGRYRSYYSYLDDPYYYDPSRRYASYNYVSDYVPGIDDLDDYGDWQYVSDYGYGWHPRVDNGWAPYQSGSWTMDYPYGLTWVSNEPWGYAPYHYGRWTYASNEWFWIPEATRSYPTYSPALVAFIPFNDQSVGWVALGPNDPYVPRYYDTNWQPVYLSRNNVAVDRIVNMSVPGAVTVVPVQDFSRVIDPRMVSRINPQAIGQVRPVMDPLAVDPLRRMALRTREARPQIDVPQAVAQRVFNTPVVTSEAPAALPFRRGAARSLRVQTLPDRVRNQTLQVADQRANQQRPFNTAPNQPASQAAQQAQERQMLELARQSARGDRNARQQMQELSRQQRSQQIEQQRAERFSAQQVQGERVRQQMQQPSQRESLRQPQQVQRDAARQQMLNSQPQRRAAAQQQMQPQREQRRQMEIQRAPAIRHSQQQQPVRPPAPVRPPTIEQRRERRPPPQYQSPAQPQVIAPQQPQMRQPPAQQRAAPQQMPQQRQAQPRPQEQRPQRQEQPKQPEQKGGRKKP